MPNILTLFKGFVQSDTPDFSPVPEGVITDVEGNNAFFQNLWTGGFFTSTLRVYERFRSDTDFQYLEIRPSDGGPYTIATVGNDGTSRNLDITASDQLILSAGGLIQLETFTETPIIFGTNATLQWQIDSPNGDLLPMQDASKSIGNNSDARVQSIFVQNTVTSAIINIGGGDFIFANNQNVPWWVIGNDGVFTIDGANPTPDIGRNDGRAPRNLWLNRGIGYRVSGDVDTFSGFVTLTFQDNGDGTARMVASTLNGPVTVFSPIPFS